MSSARLSSPVAVDTAVMVLVVVHAQLDAWTSLLGTELSGSRWVACGVLSTVGVLLWWRRSRPFQVTAAAVALLICWWAIDGAVIASAATIALMVLGYSAGRWETRRWRALLALGFIFAALVSHLVLNPSTRSWSEFRAEVPWWLLIAGLWLVGAVRRYRTLYAVGQRRTAILDERARIAREMHDVLAHGLGVMVVQAEAAQEMLHKGRHNEADACLGNVQRTGREALDDLRATIAALRSDDPASTRQHPNLNDLDQLVDRARQAGLSVEVDVADAPSRLPAEVSQVAYRLAHESLTNSLKHSQGKRARLVVRHLPNELLVEILDAGPRQHSARVGAGCGLIGLRERVDGLHGTFECGPDGPGFLVRATLPLEQR